MKLEHSSRIVRAVILLIATLCVHASLDAQSGALLTGKVSDAAGEPLVGATVTLRGTDETRVIRTTRDGRFEFPVLPDGRCELMATLTGFAPAHRVLRLRTHQKVVVNLVLTVAAQEQTTVTATRTGQRDLQVTPVAVSVLTGPDLARTGSRSVADVANLAPSVTFSQNSDYAQLTIRGIGSTTVFAGSDPSSAFYIDGVYIARPVMVLADFLDVDRVEVLRGPQGTLYGRNAMGGAINLITTPPTNELDASARVAAGSLGTLRSTARASGPLVRGRILGSVAVVRAVQDGFVRDLNHPDHPLGSQDVTAFLGKLHFVFDRRTNLLISADVGHKDPTPLTYAKVLSVKPGFVVDNPAGFRDVRTSTIARNRTVQYGGSARLTSRLGRGLTLTSLTAYRALDFDNWNDADITELDLADGHVRELQHQWSEEITLAHERAGLSWVGGVFLFDERDRQPISIRLGGPHLESRLDPDVSADSRAVFGQVRVDLTSRISTTAGFRYARERKHIANSGQLNTPDAPVTIVAGSQYAYTDSMSDAFWMPKLGVDVRLSDGVLTYASATYGFKSGGFNLTSTEAGRGYAPEWALSYEGGLKTSVASGRATLNVAAFDTDYEDLQVQTAIRPGVIDIANAASARIRGIEVEGAARVGGGVRAGGHIAWLDAAYDRYVAVGVGGVTADVAGHRLNNAPEWSGRAWLEWTGRMRHAGVASLRAEGRWQSTVFFTPFNDAIQRQRPYGLADLSAELGPEHRHWSCVVYARKLTDSEYITGTFSSPPPAIGGRPGEPRTMGVELVLRR
jgi:iron complex outermembrane receptor protein